jgi:hypothetical protein
METRGPHKLSQWRHSYTVAVLAVLAIVCAALAWRLMSGANDSFADRDSKINHLRSAKLGKVVEFSGVVTFSDPATRMLYIQDETAALRLALDGSDVVPTAKDRVHVRAQLAHEYEGQLGLRSVELEQVQVTRVGTAELPAPEVLRIPDLLEGNSLREARLIETQGIVRDARRIGAELVMELGDGGQQATVHVYGASTITPASIIDARIRVRGTLQLEVDNTDAASVPMLWVSGPQEMDILSAAPREPAFIASVRQLASDRHWLDEGHRVRMQGTVIKADNAHTLLIENSGVVLSIDVERASDYLPAQTIEAVGWPSLRRFNIELKHSRVHLIDSDAMAGSPSLEGLPLMTSIEAIRKLTADEASRAYPVHLTATISAVYDRREFFFVQSEAQGIFVDAGRSLAGLELGQQVTIDGFTARGGFAPVITQPRVQVIGVAGLPTPQNVDPEAAPTGAYDSEWVQIEGVVRPFVPSSGVLEFNLVTSVGNVGAVLLHGAPKQRLDALVDARVRVRGVFGSSFTTDGVLTGYRMFVDSLDQIEVLSPPLESTASIAVRPIQDLLRYSTAADGGSHRARIRGVVTYRAPDMLYVEDQTGSVQVVATSDSLPAEAGDEIEAIGYPAPSDRGPLLSDAMVRKTGRVSPLRPSVASAGEILGAADYDNRLVTLEARVVSQAPGPSQQTLVLQSGYTVFNAELEDGAYLPNAPEGSTVRVTGICLVQRQSLVDVFYRDFNSVPSAFRILLRTPDDVQIVSRSAWGICGKLGRCSRCCCLP